MKLVNVLGTVYDADEKDPSGRSPGKHLFSIAFTSRYNYLGDDKDRKGGESWIDYRNRIKEEMDTEFEKVTQLAKDICLAYNERFR